MATNDFLLETIDITKTYGGRTVVDHVRFGVGKAEIVGLLGRNGAGKTTSFRITIGMINPDGGQVLLHGKDISKLPMYKRAQLGMGYLSQEPSIFTRLTVEENLLAILETTPLRRRQRKQRCVRAARTVLADPYPKTGGQDAFRRRASQTGDRPGSRDQSDDHPA